MALYRVGPLIGAISGNVAGVNFANSAKRAIVRPAKRRTADQATAILASRARLQYIVGQWTLLTAIQKAAWSTLAATLRWPDRLGQARQPSGREFFLSHNLELLQAGQAIDTTSIPTPVATNMDLLGSIIFTAFNDVSFACGSLLEPDPMGISFYVQTFFRPVPQYIPAALTTPVGGLPNRWRFVKWASLSSFGVVQLWPEYEAVIGRPSTGQVVAFQLRYVAPGRFARWVRTYVSIAT